MKEKRILQALGQVDEAYIEEAAPAERADKKRGWIKWGAIAACVALAAVIAIPVLRPASHSLSEKDPEVSDGPAAFDPDEITYTIISADWPYYPDVPSLVDQSSLILLGKVTGVTFEMLDMRTARPPSEETVRQELYTVYEIEVIEQYKGAPAGTTQMRVPGGLEGVYLEEQAAALGQTIEDGIPVWEGMPEIRIGETYLFVLYQFDEKTAPTLLNPTQSVLSLENETDPSAPVSAKKILSYFS